MKQQISLQYVAYPVVIIDDSIRSLANSVKITQRFRRAYVFSYFLENRNKSQSNEQSTGFFLRIVGKRHQSARDASEVEFTFVVDVDDAISLMVVVVVDDDERRQTLLRTRAVVSHLSLLLLIIVLKNSKKRLNHRSTRNA